MNECSGDGEHEMSGQSSKYYSLSLCIQERIRSRQLRFLGHLIRLDQALYALYGPTHGKTRHERPRTNYINYNYIQKVTGHQLPFTELL